MWRVPPRAPLNIGIMEDDMKIASIAATAFLVLSLAHSPAKSHPDDMLRRIEPFLTTVHDGLTNSTPS
jgi:hypothetical protein